MARALELRPERRLLRHEFQGYKLRLQSAPHAAPALPLPAPAPRRAPAARQLSLAHARLHALHAHLRPDPHLFAAPAPTHYYAAEGGALHRLTFCPRARRLSSTRVYAVPEPELEPGPGRYHYSLGFPSARLAVLSDGAGRLHLADTGDRGVPSAQWRTVHSALPLGEGNFFVVTDCRVQKDDESRVHCLLQSVDQGEEHFSTVLTWVTFSRAGEAWKLTSTKVLSGKGVMHYAALETSCSAVYVASDNPFKFVSDSEKELVEIPIREERKIVYTWLQRADDITITVKLPTDYTADNLHISIGVTSIKISYAGAPYIDGKLRHQIDTMLTTWNIDKDGKLDILLTKSEEAMWDDLVEGGDPRGEQILDASLVEEAHRRLAHLCTETEVQPDRDAAFSTQELEECDAPSEEDTALVRLDSTNHTATHRISLSVNQYLFSINLDHSEAPALALRHDVDACLWQPYALLPNMAEGPSNHTNKSKENIGMWPVKHQGTLNAFGYVQSSKQNKKFVTCSPDFGYSVVCEATRHIFIYKVDGSSQGCQLRKRGSGENKKVDFGQQLVVNIDEYGEVLGVNATNEYLFVLTSSHLLVMEMI